MSIKLYVIRVKISFYYPPPRTAIKYYLEFPTLRNNFQSALNICNCVNHVVNPGTDQTRVQPRRKASIPTGRVATCLFCSKLTHMIFYESFVSYVGTRVFTQFVKKLKSESNKHQRPLLQCVSQVLLRLARLDPCFGVIISVNISPVPYLYRLNVFHYEATNLCSRIFYGSARFVDCTSLDQLCC